MKNFSKLRDTFIKNYRKIELSLTEKQEIFTYLNIAYDKTKDNLKNMIMQYISGNEISIQDLNNEISQLIIEYYQNKEFNKEYFNFLSFLIDFKSVNSSYGQKIYKSFSNVEDWRNVIELYAKWQNVHNVDYSNIAINELSSREKMIAKVAQELKKYKIEVKNGKFVLENKKLLKIQNDIENFIKKIGGRFCLKSIFEKLQSKYSLHLQRYLLPKQFINYNEEPKLEIPYNFLINISLKHIKEKGKTKYQNQKYLDKLFNLSSKYVFLFDLQDFHNINKNLFPQHWTIETLYKNILYDNVFRFKQMSIYNISYIIKYLFNDYDREFVEKLGFSLNDYLALICKLYNNPNNYMIEFPSKIFDSKELEILNFISHFNYDINHEYVKLQDFTKINFISKPLIKLDNSYLLIDKNYCSWGFYEVILKSLSYPDIGKNLESLIYKKLSERGYKLYKGKYKNGQQEDGECDIVIETNKKIIFIEVKKKAITSKALEGNEVKIVEDIIDSFIHSQEQILRHEYSLKSDNKISFENGDVFYLNKRDIVKVSISLFDNFTLNDKLMAVNIFEFFQKLRFLNPTKQLEEKNRKIENIIKKLNLIYKDKPQDYKNSRYDIYFLSLELFLFYLKINKSIDEVLQDVRQVSFGRGDLFFEYIELMNKGNK